MSYPARALAAATLSMRRHVRTYLVLADHDGTWVRPAVLGTIVAASRFEARARLCHTALWRWPAHPLASLRVMAAGGQPRARLWRALAADGACSLTSSPDAGALEHDRARIVGGDG